MNLKKTMDFCNDLINVFTDYSYTLDTYFKNETNRTEHKDLYEEYQYLNQNLRSIIKKNGFDKK